MTTAWMPPLRQNLCLPLVVQSPLLAAGHTRDGRATIEQRDGHGVLLLLDLDHEPQRRQYPSTGSPQARPAVGDTAPTSHGNIA